MNQKLVPRKKTDAVHSITQENAKEFVAKLHQLLIEYNAYNHDSPISLMTSNFSLHAMGTFGCPPECQQSTEYCDVNGQHCTIKVKCTC